MHYFLKKVNLCPNVAIITDLNHLIVFFVIIVTNILLINYIKQVIKLNKLRIELKIV